MTTPTIDKSAAEERKRHAAEHLQKLRVERAQLPKRQAEAVAAVERLNQEIAAGERAGAEASTLAALRAERELQRQVAEDLGRCLPTLDRELELAEAELWAATTAGHSLAYNVLVDEQRALLTTIREALDTLMAALTAKVRLAEKQERLQADVRCAYPNLSSVGIRLALQGEINKRLEGNGDRTPLQTLDWSCRPMGPCGDVQGL